MRHILHTIIFAVLGGASACGVASDIAVHRYKVYEADLNSDERQDYYFEGIPLVVPIHGDIVTPILLSAPQSFVVYSYDNIFLTPVYKSFTAAEISNHNLQISSATVATLQAVIANATADAEGNEPDDPSPPTPPAPSTSTDNTRTLAGKFDVTSNGQATYSIPIVTAPGSAGLVPDVSLNYSSGGGNGIAGLGWSLNAASGISRCRQTYGHDHNADQVACVIQDRFCLIGESLIVVSGSYGTPGSQYKTEIDNFDRITEIGGSFGHPNSFSVEYKNGIIETYGNTTDSANSQHDVAQGRVMTWALSARRDSAANKIIYHYIKTNQSQRIDRIEYAFGVQTSRGAHLQFEYEGRNDPVTTYVVGHLTQTNHRLRTIKSFNGGLEIRRYELTYNEESATTSHDTTSRINKIRECVGSVCGLATHFEWSIPASAFPGTGVNLSLTGGVFHSVFGDVNGDGLMDVVWHDRNNRLRYAFSSINASGQLQFIPGTFGAGASQTFYLSTYSKSPIQILDYNGDGRSDVHVSNGVLLSLPQPDGSWRLSDTVSSLPLAGVPGAVGAYALGADINGDGLPDWLSASGGYSTYEVALFNTSYIKYGKIMEDVNSSVRYQVGPSFDVTQSLTTGPTPCDQPQLCIYAIGNQPIKNIYSAEADFNGDGRIDVLARAIRTVDCQNADIDGLGIDCRLEYRINPYVLKSTDGSTSGAVDLKLYGGSDLAADTMFHADEIGHFLTTDLNNDGLSDLVYGRQDRWYVRLSTGNGFTPAKLFMLTENHQGRPSLQDINGDGYPDFIWVDGHLDIASETNIPPGKLRVKYWVPQVNNFSDSDKELRNEMGLYGTFKRTNPGIPAGQIGHVIEELYRYPYFNHLIMDFNGDGKVDFVRQPARDSGAVTVVLNAAGSLPRNKITSIQIEEGNVRDIRYEPISRSAHYTRISGFNMASQTKETCLSAYDEYSYQGQTCWDTEVHVVNAQEFYRSLNDPWHELGEEDQSLRPASPVLEALGPMYVVTAVDASSPTGTNIPGEIDTSARAGTYYFYERSKMQAGGRGFLGFEYFTKVNRETGLREKTRYRQDWPYIGRPIRTEIFTADGHLLSVKENLWGISSCYSGGAPSSSCVNNLNQTLEGQGITALGALDIFLREFTSKSYALKNNGAAQGDLISTTIETNIQDAKGNVLESVSATTSNLSLPEVNKTTINAYDYSGATWSMQQGRLQRISVTTTNDTYGPITRISNFNYYTSGTAIGLLKTETIEPDNSAYTVATTHSYNQGNRVKSISTFDGKTRQKEVGYDSRGRYIDYIYGFFTNGVNPDSSIRRVVSHVVARDKYGTPTEVRNYNSPTNYVTKRTTTNVFGIPYFMTEDTGASSEIKIGSGDDTYNICPDDTKRWTITQLSGGGTSINCSDILGRLRRAGTIGFDGTKWSVVDTEYDKLGRIIRTSAPYWHNSSDQYWTSTNYDVLGRPTKVVSPYKSGYVNTLYSYSNLETTITNSKLQKRIEKRDLLGQVVEVVDPNNGITSFAYDARGNMREMKDPALNTTTIEYDLLDRKISMSDPDKGSWTYKYNNFGDLICEMDGKGQTSIKRYDIAGRIFSRTDRFVGGTCDNPQGEVEKYSQWTYDTATNGLGQLASVFDSSSVNGGAQYQQNFTYDVYGRPDVTTTTLPGHLGQMSSHYEKVTYDQYNRVLKTFDAARVNATFTSNGVQNVYNSRGYLQKIIDAVNHNGSQQNYYTINEMDARGNVIKAEYGNGVVQQASYYSESGLTKSLRADRVLATLPLQDITLDWDEVGNLKWRVERGTAEDPARRNIREDFDYDNLNRLRTWTSSGDLAANETATYSNIDNITNKTGVGAYLYGDQCGENTNAGPHAVCRAGTTNYLYDKNGNMLNDSAGRVMKYTSYDLPAEISKSGHKIEFSYGPSRERYKRVDTSTGNQYSTTLYLGSVEKVYHSNGSIQWKRFIAGIGLITQTVDVAGAKLGEAQRYLIKDHLGSIKLITDEIGAVEQSNQFDPWGKARKVVTSAGIKQWQTNNEVFSVGSTSITTRGFTGHEHLAEVGLIHMNGRIYDETLGRFVQADPIIQDPLRVQSLNRYSYVWNNPLNATDPSGFTACHSSGGAGVGQECQHLKNASEGDKNVKLGADSCSSGDCQNYIYRKGDVEEVISVNKKETAAFEKEMSQAGVSIGSYGSDIGGSVGRDDGYVSGRPGSWGGITGTFNNLPVLGLACNHDLECMTADGVESLEFAFKLMNPVQDIYDCTTRECSEEEKLFAAVSIIPAVKWGRRADELHDAVQATKGLREADSIANGPKLAKQLRLESANSPFTENGYLTDDAVRSSREIIPASEINNPAIPKGFSKYSTETFQSPSGNFQAHFYKNPKTGEVFYGRDYKVILNLKSGG